MPILEAALVTRTTWLWLGIKQPWRSDQSYDNVRVGL